MLELALKPRHPERHRFFPRMFAARVVPISLLHQRLEWQAAQEEAQVMKRVHHVSTMRSLVLRAHKTNGGQGTQLSLALNPGPGPRPPSTRPAY